MNIVIIHDYMRDVLDKEFEVTNGNSEDEAIDKAWEILRKTGYIYNLTFDYTDKKVTKESFKKKLIETKDSEDAILITAPYYIYVKLVEIKPD